MPGIPGDTCLIDSHCMIGLNCLNLVCDEPVLPPGEEGDECDVDENCKDDLVCRDKICMEPLGEEGDSCNFFYDC